MPVARGVVRARSDEEDDAATREDEAIALERCWTEERIIVGM
jgi:hypothetical protein